MFLGRHTLHLDLPRDAWCFGFWESRRQSSRPPKTSAPQIKRKHHPKSSCFKHNLDFKRDFAPKTATFGELPSHKKKKHTCIPQRCQGHVGLHSTLPPAVGLAVIAARRWCRGEALVLGPLGLSICCGSWGV